MSIGLPVRFAKNFFLQRNFPCFDAPSLFGAFQDEDAAVSKVDLRGFPGPVGTLVPEFEGVSGRGFIFVGGDPASDGLPGWVDGLEGVDVKRRFWWWRQADEGFPQAEEAEEKLDFFWPGDGFDAAHGALATGALEGIGAPDAEDKVPPEGAHGAGRRKFEG